MRIEKDGRSIGSLEDWKAIAPPKSGDQWKEGRSALELARSWCGDGVPRMPPELRTLLDSRNETQGMAVECVTPELKVPFDPRRGEPRNADLAFIGETPSGRVAVTIEAKADESFGATVADTFGAALERFIETKESEGIPRIQDLARSLFRPRPKLQPDERRLPRVAALRYQLLTAAAGSIAYAIRTKAPLAVLIVHEFVTRETQDENHARNEADYRAFVARLGNGSDLPSAAGLIGPFLVPGEPLFQNAPPLLIGKVATDRRR